MEWEGTIYSEKSGDYKIDTTYAPNGAFSTIKYLGKIIGYAKDIDEAKEKAEEHAERYAEQT